MSVEVLQWRRRSAKQPCYLFITEKGEALFHVELYHHSHHNGEMWLTAEQIEKDFPKLLSGEDIAGALAAFERPRRMRHVSPRVNAAHPVHRPRLMLVVAEVFVAANAIIAGELTNE